MTLVYKSICMEIDELTIKLIHLCEKLIQYKLAVEKEMSSGFCNIAKARYIMGRKCVSTLQLPTRYSNPIQPLVRLCRAPYEGYWIFKANKRKPTPVPSEEQMKSIVKPKDSEEYKHDLRNLLDKDSKLLRKRKEFYLVDDSQYSELNDELQDEVSTDSAESQESLVTLSDPIRLFGVLVPNTLRTAQMDFQETIDIIAACASIQSEIHMILERCSHLKKVKGIMENAAEERDIDLSEEKKYFTPSEVSTETSETMSDQITSEEAVSEVKEDTEVHPQLYGEDVEDVYDGSQIVVSEDSIEYFKTSAEFDETADNSPTLENNS